LKGKEAGIETCRIINYFAPLTVPLVPTTKSRYEMDHIFSPQYANGAKVAGDSCFGCETFGKGVYIKVRF
jgi:hypothetical protein